MKIKSTDIINALSNTVELTTPQKRVWFAVLARAIEDLKKADSSKNSTWFFEPQSRPLLAGVCAVFDLDPNFLCELLARAGLLNQQRAAA